MSTALEAGKGIHTGRHCVVRLHRADGPVRFRRGRVEIPARLNLVASTARSVTLEHGGERVSTVEHLLAALHIGGFWSGVVIEASEEELPILDGSSLPWFAALGDLGEPPLPPPPLVPSGAVSAARGGSRATLGPGRAGLDVEIDFANPAVGRQRWRGTPSRYRELLDARTFGFLAELESLRAAGLASGAGLENAIVFDGNGPLSPLRHQDEPVRHKALDLLGDLFLLGRPLQAQVTVSRGSHTLHVDLMRNLARSTIPEEPDA